MTSDTYTGEEDDVLSLHLYTYCGNDGVNAVDPSGCFISKNHVGAKIGTLYGGLGNRFKKYFDNISKGSTNFYKVYAKTSSTDVWKHNYKNIDKYEATSNANYILNYLKGKGWNELSVCAIIGNFFIMLELMEMKQMKW